MFYITLFLLFLYFKIARVHKKEQRLKPLDYALHIAVFIAAMILYMYGFTHISFLWLLVSTIVFFIGAALMVTAVQLGIFVDGKPLLGISKLYKIMPFLAGIIVLLSLQLASL